MLSSSPLDPVAPVRREALRIILMASLGAVALTLPFSLWLGWGKGYTLGLALLTVGLGALLGLAGRPQAQDAVGTLYFGLGAVTCVGTFAWNVLIGQNQTSLFGGALWLPLMYLTTLLIFPPRGALGASLLLYGAFVSVGIAYFAREGVSSAAGRDAATVFVQIYLSHAVFIGLHVTWERLLRRSVLAAHDARLEARFAYEDALTGLANRRQLSKWLDEALVGGGGAAVLFDLDAFKRVNDERGHDAGDEVLRATGHVMLAALSQGARCGRWGGEEFLVVLPGAGEAQAVAVAETLRGAIAAHPYPAGLRITASFGVSVSQAGDDLRLLLSRADAALYAAKREGRDRVRLAA